MRGAVRGVPVDVRAGDPALDVLSEPFGQPPLRGRHVAHRRERRGERRGHAGDAGGVLHAGAPLALAVVAARVGGDAHPPAHVERADARRPAELVAGQREQIDPQGLHVDGEPAHRLTRIRVEAHLGLPREPRRLGDLLEGPDLVVRVLDARKERARLADLRGVPVHVDPSVAVDGHDHHFESVALEGMAHAADRRMFDGAHHDARPQLADGAHAAPDRERHRLRAARREHDLVGLGADRLRDRRARVLDERAGGAAGVVDVQGVAERVERVHHRIARGREQRRRGGVVEVDVGRHHSGVKASPAPSPSGRGTSTGPRRRCRPQAVPRSTRTSR